jgi:hypothetical protein
MLNVRSGELVAGNFAHFENTGKPGDANFVAKIYWEPLHNGVAKANKLSVSVVNLRERSQPARVQRFPEPEQGRWQRSTDGYYFWAAGIRLPGHGRWQLTGEAPGHWGCFLITT